MYNGHYHYQRRPDGGAADYHAQSFYYSTRGSAPSRQNYVGHLQNFDTRIQPTDPYSQNARICSPSHSLHQNASFPLRLVRHSRRPEEILQDIERAVIKARDDTLAAGKSLSSWEVSQSALLYLHADSWASLGFQFQQIPSLYRIILTEGKVNAFIHCFVGVRRIVSMYDLEIAICKSEGIDQYEALGLGPFLRHPLAQHYFLVPSDMTKIVPIRTEDIICSLAEFMDTCNDSAIKVDAFLDFLSTKWSVSSREQLGVRLQNLGMYINSIREARKSEKMALKNGLTAVSRTPAARNKESLQPHEILSEKHELNKRFNAISDRVRMFSVSQSFCGKHTRFVSSSSEDGSSDDESDKEEDCSNSGEVALISNFIPNAKDGKRRVGRCPYPSAAEEMARLALKGEMDVFATLSGGKSDTGKLHDKKRKTSMAPGRDISTAEQASGKKKKKKHDDTVKHFSKSSAVALDGTDHMDKTSSLDSSKIQNDNAASEETKTGKKQNDDYSFILSRKSKNKFMHLEGSNNEDLQNFITTWKEACREQPVTQVFYRMLQFYKPGLQKIRRILQSNPVVGLLNVAVQSIKQGMWDSIYDAFQAIGEHDFTTPNSLQGAEIVDILPLSEMHRNEHDSSYIPHVTVDDIVNKIAAYFNLEHFASTSRHEDNKSLDKYFQLFTSFHACEMWLAKQFYVNDFTSLGHGGFFQFLKEQMPTLPYRIGFIPDQHENLSMEVVMLQNQLLALLSQVANSLGEGAVMTTESIYLFLRMQFPLISFEIKQSLSVEELRHVIRGQKNSDQLCFTFSAALLGQPKSQECLILNEELSSEIKGIVPDPDQKTGCLGPVSGKDAAECLLKAPMLCDLLSWSHWDLIYAPSLGPLVGWMMTQVHAKDLGCIFTRNGRLVRIDPGVTVDSFMEALLHGSSYQTAVKLLSLVFLYRGIDCVPLSLLKCYASRAIEAVMNTAENQDQGVSAGKKIFDMGFNGSLLPFKSPELCANSVTSRFILDCLTYLPPEFRNFAADILLSGMKCVVKDAYAAILHECSQTDERVMLHDIGLYLGIREWIEDHHAYTSAGVTDSLTCSDMIVETPSSTRSTNSRNLLQVPGNVSSVDCMVTKEVPHLFDEKHEKVNRIDVPDSRLAEATSDSVSSVVFKCNKEEEATHIIKSIRREEFGLDSSLDFSESSLLKKQHARLGRALQCLSQELYSQDSHFILELVQNADDNIYPANVDPTLVFILQANGIVVLNNELGFSAQNIRALCDVGNSTKKGSAGGYIGQKGIGFKSVFRVTDAPEIHSNGFHVKFDMHVGQIGFVLPTLVSPCDITAFIRHICPTEEPIENNHWNTCIMLPFRSELRGGMKSILSLFSDLHPSLLLFLQRLQCIKFKNMLDDSLNVMRREIVGNGLVRVSHGEDKMTWLVAKKHLFSESVRSDVKTTEIAIAFTLDESKDGEYIPHLKPQPAFAFLPLRTYGLKFIIQGDFVLPSSREEVDGDNAWNQWLLSEFPALFVSAERLFCGLPCFQESPGKAVSTYMSFVPLIGEVHGFFSQLPRLIFSRLRSSSCLLLEGSREEWVPPCRVLRGWDHQVQALLPDNLLHQHLGLSYLDKDIILSDSLSKALGIQSYGPKILIETISSLCQRDNGIKSLGLEWLFSWLNALYSTLSTHANEREDTLFDSLRRIPFIPLSDGSYGSLAEGPVWLPDDSNGYKSDFEPSMKYFQNVYAKLRIVHPSLLYGITTQTCIIDMVPAKVVTGLLSKLGVKKLSDHEIIRSHILAALSDNIISKDKHLMVEYLCFVMLHLQTSCHCCQAERADIILSLQGMTVILTNHGYKCSLNEPVHFGKEFDNPIDMKKLIVNTNESWNEVDPIYLSHPCNQLLSFGLKKWRNFLQELGVTDFVSVICVKKNLTNISENVSSNITWNKKDLDDVGLVEDWESPELVHLLSTLSLGKSRDGCQYLLEILDSRWDGFYAAKATTSAVFSSSGDSKVFIETSFMKNIRNFKWIPSSVDGELHYPRDLFFKCDSVHSILGDAAPYASPQVKNQAFLQAIGFRTRVTLDDAISVLLQWSTSKSSFVASIAHMSKFYSFMWNEITDSRSQFESSKIMDFKSTPIFLPLVNEYKRENVVTGSFSRPEEVYWCDPTGCIKHTMELACYSFSKTISPSKILSHVYPNLQDFFVNICGVCISPSFSYYIQILLQLSDIAPPSQAANSVFQVLLKWANDLKSGLVVSEEISFLKESLHKMENTVLPTVQERWVSLHSHFGLICWSDDDELMKQFKHSCNIDFLDFGEHSIDEKERFSDTISNLMKVIGVPALSEVVSREAIFYGAAESTEKASIVNWILPYAQRYLYKNYPNKYFSLKQFIIGRLNQLQVAVVEKLYYRLTIKGCGSTSKRRFECSSLLQGDVLYVTRNADTHSLFLELSTLFFDGAIEVHFANFLDMIVLRAESGSTKEQMELFIVNSQKVPQLPNEECMWSLSCIPSLTESEPFYPVHSFTENSSGSKRRIDSCFSWPATDWKTAPDFHFSLKAKPGAAPAHWMEDESHKHKRIICMESFQIPSHISDNFISLGPAETLTQDTPTVKDEYVVAGTAGPVVKDLNLTTADTAFPPGPGPAVFTAREQLLLGTPDENQALRTGRLGELTVYNFFVEKLGHEMVKWVNKERETGLPFDLVIGQKEENKEFIEVKATKALSKDWFTISVREWQFASERGDSFSVAHVILSDPKDAKITILKNPVKLCQQDMLRLVILMPRQHKIAVPAV